MSRNRRVVTLVVLTLSLSLLTVGGLVGVGDVAAQGAEGNDTQSPHEHPDGTIEDGDTDRVAAWLQDRLSRALGESITHLEEGQYDQARAAIGDDYDRYLSQYAEVADESEVREYEEAQANQLALINNVEAYNSTYEEYEAAREAGDDQRARELAHELERLSESIADQGDTAQRQHESVEEDTGADTSEARGAVERIRADIETTQQAVRDSEFVPTELTVETESDTASFDDPMTINGTITTPDGASGTSEPITVIGEQTALTRTDGITVADERITLEIGERTVRTPIDDAGSFSVEYRPTTESLETTELEIGYVPDTRSEYGSAETTVPVRIEQTDPSVEITETTTGVAFDENVTVGGTVAADGVGVDSVPVVVFVDGDRLGEVETNEEGAFELTTSLPADVRAGEVEVRAVVALDDRAIGGAATTTATEVAETPGSVDVTADHRDDSLYVQGSLATEDGRPVAGEPVRLEFGGETVTVETDAEGRYETVVDVPAGAGTTVTVDAIYARDESNIGDTSATTDLRVGEGTVLTRVATVLGIGGLVPDLPSVGPEHWFALVGVLLLGGVGAYFVIDRRGRSFEPGSAVSAAGSATETADTSLQDSTALRATLLDSARDQARAGNPARAVKRAYVAVRQDGTDHSRAYTHWEFYRAFQERGFASDRIDALRTLTERFERATFSTLSVSSEDAHVAIEEAETVIGET